MESNDVILYDGTCNLSTRSVQFTINHDPDGYFKFSSLHSAAGQRLVASRGMQIDNVNSLILLKDYGPLTRSDAVLSITQQLSGLWSLFFLLTIIPRIIRDWCYDLISCHRYKWFGKLDFYSIPTDFDQERILK